ncbi:hypothetical protein BSL78_12517 [Apostichopus japonicus]|uniref:Neuronal acetylcholine receptor subunit alpha-10-like n=1 Tax=Stichopus japonicus TaxID=307972 RepID=A0A2G8KRM9_STIJA|nr:hypothetical protein BSL78_12517 [Apostichopus japonicus]
MHNGSGPFSPTSVEEPFNFPILTFESYARHCGGGEANQDCNERYTNVEKKRTIPLIVHFDGNVILLTPQIYTTHCKMNLTYYPFDSQVCLLKFGSWAYDGTQVNVSSLVEQAESSSYLHNGEWDLTKVSFQRHVAYYSCCPEPYPDVEYTLQLTRRPWFYIWNLIVPFITITILSSFAFFIPPESGEKVSLAVTSLLSLVVFTQLVLNTIPAASDGTQPIIGMYFVISVIVLSIVVVLSVVSLHAYHKKDSGQHVPPLVRFIVLTCMGTICVRLKCLQIQSPELEPHPSSRLWNPDNNAHLPQNWMKDSGKNLNRTRNISSQKRRNEEDISVVDSDREFPIFSPLSLRKGTTTCRSSRHDEREAGSVLLRIEAMLKNFLQHRTEKKRQDDQNNFLETRSREWIEVSRVFDRFLLIVFTSLFCILPIIISLKCSSML